MFAEASERLQIVNACLNAFGAFVGAVCAVLTAWIVFKQAQLKAQVAVVAKATDGLSSALAEAKLAQGKAEGTMTGLKEARVEAAAAHVAAPAATIHAAEVKIDADTVHVGNPDVPPADDPPPA